jgi:hypothetical protein
MANGANSIVYADGTVVIEREIYGLSTDTKPTKKIHNGEKFIEMDTGNLFVFDEEAATWHPL